MAFNPNAVFISPSTLADVEKCPQSYYYHSVYKSPRGFKIQLINPSLALGQIVHDCLAQFLMMEPNQRTPKELARIFNLLWQGVNGEKGGFGSPELENEYRLRAEGMLKRFWANEHFRGCVGAKIPAFPKVDLGQDIILTGKLDWVERDEDGGYVIVDFKTGKNKEREDSYQLPIYAVLVNAIFQCDKIRAKYWYLDKDESLEDVTLPEIKDSLETLRGKGELLKMVKQTNSYRCQSGGESCWACKDILAVAKGQGKLVGIDMNRKQEIYILTGSEAEQREEYDLPF